VKMQLTIGGLSCLDCLSLIAEKMKGIPVVESVSINSSKRVALVQGKKRMGKDGFLEALSDTPYLLREINDSENCHCCSQLYFSFQ